MGRIPWRKGKVVSIETRSGLFALGQMLDSPYMLFFEKFSDSLDWPSISLDQSPQLFIAGVVNQFLSQSNAKHQKHLSPVEVVYPRRWLTPNSEPVFRTVWTGTSKEITVEYIGRFASLIERNLSDSGADLSPERIVIPKVSTSDDKAIQGCELDTLSAHPYLNERLYLCHLLRRNVDVRIDLILRRSLPSEYETYLRYISLTEEQLSDFGPNELEKDPKMTRAGGPPSELKGRRLK